MQNIPAFSEFLRVVAITSGELLNYLELMAYKAYKNPELLLHYWRTSTGQEVDFILGDMEIAIEIKTSKRVHESDIKPLQVLQEEYKLKRLILVSFENEPKMLDKNIECIPWRLFLESLWNGDLC